MITPLPVKDRTLKFVCELAHLKNSTLILAEMSVTTVCCENSHILRILRTNSKYQQFSHFLLLFRSVRKIAKNELLASSYLYVCLSVHLSQQNNLASTGWVFIKFDILSIFRKYVEKNLTSITGTLHEDQYIFFLILCPSVLLRMINVTYRVVKKVKTHVCSVTFFILTVVPFVR